MLVSNEVGMVIFVALLRYVCEKEILVKSECGRKICLSSKVDLDTFVKCESGRDTLQI